MNSTNTEAGLRLGYELAQRYYRDGVINRVVLATDGVANVGNTDPNVLAQYAQDYYGRNIFLSTVGVAMATTTISCWSTLADKGNGVYSFLDSSRPPSASLRRTSTARCRPSPRTPRSRSISTRTSCAPTA